MARRPGTTGHVGGAPRAKSAEPEWHEGALRRQGEMVLQRDISLLVGVAMATALLLLACTGDGASGAITIRMEDNFFEPAEVRLRAGEPVMVIARNTGKLIHNLTVPGTPFRSDMVVNAGRSSEFEVRFDEPGTYTFQCDFHVPGMVGAFIVE